LLKQTTNVPIAKITKNTLDKIEKEMIKSFYYFIRVYYKENKNIKVEIKIQGIPA